jgi:DNA-directed RNA polymerase sigma subunit (sigma70/sigma32)
MRKISDIKADNRKRFVAYITSYEFIGSNIFEDFLSENSKISEKISSGRISQFLNSAQKILDYDQIQILDLRHGLDGAAPSSFKDIAYIFGESRSKILSRYNPAIEKIRPYFEALLSLP